MKMLIVHLSDLHFKEEINSISQKKEQIIKAFQNEIMDIKYVFIVITGDIAFSGKEAEYKQAKQFLDNMIDKIIAIYNNIKIQFVIIPGNHDCDFSIKPEIRKTIIDKILKEEYVNEEFINQCCEVQSNYFSFTNLFEYEGDAIYSDKLIKIIKYILEDYSIIFTCYNTSWTSMLNEEPGKLYFPIKRYKDHFKIDSDLNISILHHNLNWFKPENRRIFSNHIEKTSAIVLTGHEHVSSKSSKSNLDDTITEYIEGAVLQDHQNIKNSGFNVIKFDIKKVTQKIYNFMWKDNIYLDINQNKPWISYKPFVCASKKTFQVNDKFESTLEDPGASFTHPHKSDLKLSDFYVFPSLRNTKAYKEQEDEYFNDVEEANTLCGIDKKENTVLLLGSEKSGKTSLCKILFKEYYNRKYVPVLINGCKINKSSIADFNKIIFRCYKEQYSEKTLENFKQLENKKKVIMIDDFDKVRLNTKYRSKLIVNLNTYYPNIIITVNDLFPIEEITYHEKQNVDVFRSYKEYQILEFGHLLRDKLINKWNTLGLFNTISEDELLRKNTHAKRVIDTIIGSNYIPSYPIFLLIILQAIEVGNPQNLKSSSYGYYYDYLITRAFIKIKKTPDEIDAYANYIAELAKYIFDKKCYEITEDELHDFHEYYCEYYNLRIDFNEYLKNLLSTSILEESNRIYRFKYNYLYYFFVAKYLSNNINENKIREQIKVMSKRLYISEFANIILFLTYHSKDPFIITNILENAKKIFSELNPVRLEKDISVINNLTHEMPKLVLENIDVKDSREEILRKRDELEYSEKNESKIIENEDYDLEKDADKDLNELDVIPKLNLSFKTIEILGQILKNYYGSLAGETKITLGEEAYFIGLRSLKSFFDILEKNIESVVDDITTIINKEKIDEREKIEKLSRKFVFMLCWFVTYSFIKKISESVGSEKLKETFKKILGRNDTISVNLIDISIKLDFYKTFPYSDIKKLKIKLSGNNLSYTILKAFVIDYLYMFPTSHEVKQRICNTLGISIERQRAIDLKSTQKKVK